MTPRGYAAHGRGQTRPGVVMTAYRHLRGASTPPGYCFTRTLPVKPDCGAPPPATCAT